MSTISQYLIKSNSNDIYVTPEELRLLIVNSELEKSVSIFEIFREEDIPPRKLDVDELNNIGGLLLWYRTKDDAKRAYTEILQLAADNLPPVSLDIEFAYLSMPEMSYCLALRGFSVFEGVIEDWLTRLSYKAIEEEIEQGAMVFNYYADNAEIFQSASFTSNSAPRKVEELKSES